VRPLLLGVACLLLTGCGGHSAAAPARAGQPSSQPTHVAFVPHVAIARTASWTLPVASARQGVVPLDHGRVLVAGGLVAGDASTGRVSEVDLASGRVRAMPALAVPVHDVAGALAGGVPLVIGGGNATEQDVVQALRGRAWQVVGHLPTTRSDLAAVPDGSDALVIGGYDGGGTPTTVLRVSADGSVHPEGRLVRGLRYAAAAVAGHTAYLFGGEVLGRELDVVQAVDLGTGRTRVVAHLPAPLGHAMAAAVGGRILLMGGRTSPDRQTAAMWWFDPATAGFSRAGTLPEPVSDAAVGIGGRRVWLLGGEDPSVTDHVVFVNVR
jgi:hypothetical protein